MGDTKRRAKAGEQLNPLPGVTGERAEKTISSPTGGQTGGLFSDSGDGTLGHAG